LWQGAGRLAVRMSSRLTLAQRAAMPEALRSAVEEARRVMSRSAAARGLRQEALED
jgi:RNA-splicing ligase RtcB